MRTTRPIALRVRVAVVVAGALALLLAERFDSREASAQKAPAAGAAKAPDAAQAPDAEKAPLGNRFGLAAPKPRATGTIRVATYNVLNLFDHVDDPALTGEYDDLAMATSDDRCRGLAAALRAVDADIVAVEEVESLEALTWFRDTYLKDAGYDHLASVDVGYYRGVECSVMSRFPITQALTWPNESLDDVVRGGPGWSEVPEASRRGLRYQRSPLRVDVRVNEGYELTLFVVHHKAGPTFGFHREAEAIRTVELIERVRAEDPARNVIVLGDFNAAPWDKSLRVYLAAGMIDTLAHRIVARGKEGRTESDLYKTHESDRVLDYVLLNSAAHREFVIGSAHVFGTLFDPAYDWQKDPFPEGYAADHYPVIVDLAPRDRM